MAYRHLPIVVENLPIDFVLSNGALRPKIAQCTKVGVVKVIAGPAECNVVIDARRPYYLPLPPQCIHAKSKRSKRDATTY
jgi:hypothetical protein